MNNAKIYQTKQKSYILNLLTQNKDNHMTAEQMLDILKQSDTPVGKATLYRFLDILVENGTIKRYNLDNGSYCYQYVDEHAHECRQLYHLRCNVCGQIFHTDDETIKKMNGKIEKELDFKIDQTKTIFYGTCKKCQQEGQK